MKKLIPLTVLAAIVAILTGCPAPAANNAAANKPANAANTANTAAAPAADTAAVEAEIKKLANDGVAAILKNDTAALDKLWADNYMFIAQDGSVSTKAQRLESMKSGTSKIDALSYDEMNVRSNPEGTGAILIGRLTVKGTNLGKAVEGKMRFSQVWAKSKDGWRAVSGQVTPLAGDASKAGDTKPTNTAPAANK
jgi:ketosteroid isomerase-like protein